MKIGQVSHLYRPSVGGIENYVHRLNQSVREAGHDPVTYTTDLSLQGGEVPVDDESVTYARTNATALRNPFSVELYRTVRDSDLDLYHLHNPWFLSTFTAAKALDNDVPTVMTVHSAQITNDSQVVRALNALYKPFAQYIFDRVDHSFVQGESERERLLDQFDVDPQSISVVPNGIHADEYDVSEESVQAFNEAYGLDPDKPTVLFVSRLIPKKNPGAFVDAIASHLQGRDVQALVIGEGDEEFIADLQRRADDRIQFTGTIPFEELKTAYHAADLFVFLGTWEGLPTVILEAMNARCPVISTPVGAIPDAVSEPENGIIVPTSPSPRAVATAIRYYLDQPDERVAVGERNRDRVREQYDWSSVADDIIDRYETVLEDERHSVRRVGS